MQVVNKFTYLSLFSLFVFQTQAMEKFRVVDSDTQKGVRAYIYIIDAKENKKKVSITGLDGYVQVEFTCGLLETLVVYPVVHRAYYYDTFECPVSINTVSLRSNKRQVNLVKNAEWSIDKGDFGTAALAYTEAAYRLSTKNQNRQEFLALEVNAYNAAANYFSVSESTVFDVKQNKPVMSSQLKQAIIELQSEKGLQVTGNLDFQTLSTMSSKSLSEVLFVSPEQN
ncbi:peptidoglycan-binding protein [Vibrio kanaloae]|uniref:peptidoglycan-binding domain-containing protein n=1 Tax=Vibrio kanaloae TaxID=170673 RepID=UPI00148B73B0|nr:peptidoglycan-binding domain-containing protein [Vibrio kanaloae]NOI02047.1 peptidoglycan-binding protein [Vibrio kanaloae]